MKCARSFLALSIGLTICMVLVACGGGGGSSLAPVTPPAAPQVVEPVDLCAHAGPSPTLDWDSAGGTAFTIFWSTDKATVEAGGGNSASAADSWFRPGDLQENTTYYWRVVCSNSAGTKTSPVWTFTTCQRNYYVNGSSGNDGNDGTSTGNAVRTLSRALELGQSGCTIHVANGTYSGADNRGLDLGTRWVTIVSDNGAGSTTIDCGNANRAFTVGYAGHPIIEGFTIRNCQTNGDGGAVFCRDGSPTFKSCTFQSCTGARGGAIAHLGWGSTVIDNCNLNVCSGTAGGGVFLGDSATLLVKDSTLESCSAASGGGIYCKGTAKVTCRNSRFYRCNAASDEVF